MGRRPQNIPERMPPTKRRRPRDPEAYQNYMTSIAYDLVEERILNGTASAQETVYFLKLGAEKTKLENEILELQKDLVKAKTEALKSQQVSEELYAQAIAAMQDYKMPGPTVE